jgi:hypothetical protein
MLRFMGFRHLKWQGAPKREAAQRRASLRGAAHGRALPRGAIAAISLLGAALAAGMATVASGADAEGGPPRGSPPPTRLEARSPDLLAVALVQGDRMIIHLSRLLDNAPLRDAEVTVVLRGTAHPTVAEADGSYTLTAKDLTLPGSAAVDFQVVQSQLHENLHGVLQAESPAAAPEEKSNSRQMWWWALNFGVCIGFLALFSRRKKSAQS